MARKTTTPPLVPTEPREKFSIHIFPESRVERPYTRKGKPAYRWVQAYAKANSHGITNPLTLTQWREIAKQEGSNLILHEYEDQARLGMAIELVWRLYPHCDGEMASDLKSLHKLSMRSMHSATTSKVIVAIK